MKDYFSYHASEDYDEEEKFRPYRDQVFRHFAALEGMVLEYYGADDSSHEFKLDGIIFKVLEDPNDGYRSHLGVIEYGEKRSDAIFFRTPIASVRVETYDELDRSDYNVSCEGYRLVDTSDGHIWLEFGTDNTDDYYPYFVFNHHPKHPG